MSLFGYLLLLAWEFSPVLSLQVGRKNFYRRAAVEMQSDTRRVVFVGEGNVGDGPPLEVCVRSWTKWRRIGKARRRRRVGRRVGRTCSNKARSWV